jgi:hypothetical protein
MKARKNGRAGGQNEQEMFFGTYGAVTGRFGVPLMFHTNESA